MVRTRKNKQNKQKNNFNNFWKGYFKKKNKL